MADPTAMNPELVSWGKTLAQWLISSGALIGAARFFIVRPLKKAEDERDEYKKLWKDEQLAREKRIEEAETALFGRPSMRYREELPTISMLKESTPKMQHEEELQRRLLAERARDLAPTTVLEAFAPAPAAPAMNVVEVDGRPVEKRNTPTAPKGYPAIPGPGKLPSGVR